MAFVLRMHQLAGPTLWYDEAASWKTIQFPWPEMFQSIERNVHPPVYYILLKLWASVCGYSTESLRGFSVLFGVATVGVIGLIVREGVQPTEVEPARPTDSTADTAKGGAELYPFLAATLYAINPISIEQSQQARMYALGIFFAAILGWGTVRILRTPGRWSGWGLVILAGNLLPLTHYYGLLTSLVAVVIIVCVGVKRSTHDIRFRRLLIVRLAVAACVTLPVWMYWAPVFFAQHARVQANYWIPQLTKWELVFICAEWVSSPFVRNWGLPVNACMFCFWVMGVTLLIVSKNPTRWAVVALALGPPLASTLYSLATRNLLQGRYWCFAHLFFVVGLVISVQGIHSLRVRRGVAFLLVGMSLFWNTQDRFERQNLTFASGLKRVGQLLKNVLRPGDIVVVASPFFQPTIQHEVGQTEDIYVAAMGIPLTHFQGSAILGPEEIIALPDTLTLKTHRMWLVTDDKFSKTMPDPAKLPLPTQWQRSEGFEFFEGNRLQSHLEVRRYDR